MKTIKVLTIFVFTGLLLLSCGEKKKEMNDAAADETTEASTLEDATQETTAVATQETTEAAVVEEVAPNIIEVAVGNEAFSTFATAVTLAGLVEALTAEGPYTVFAPTNDAFSKLPKGALEDLKMPENKDDLIELLKYHVVEGKYEAAAVIEAINANDGKFTVTTIQGGSIDLSLKDGNVLLTDANGNKSTVMNADISASNGVIHALDKVVMP